MSLAKHNQIFQAHVCYGKNGGGGGNKEVKLEKKKTKLCTKRNGEVGNSLHRTGL